MEAEALAPPLPQDSWASQIVTEGNVVVMPADSPRFKQKAGILDVNGRYVAHGATYRFDKAITLRPDPPVMATRELRGRWLWAGVLFDHFGHFLVESMSRLWALHSGQSFDGICYTPKRPRRKGGLYPFQQEVLTSFGATQPVELIREPTSVETLVVPGQGFGLGSIVHGTPEMRAAVRDHFGTHIPADGPEKLYVSRSGLGQDAGAIMNEAQIEAYLADEGYEIFHPQNHSISVQIARYKAARQVIISDGSAGHLFAYVGREDQDVAYLPRRSFWADGPIDHIAAFSGRAPLELDTLSQEWVPREKRKEYRGWAFVLHDMKALQDKLASAGFVEAGKPWTRTRRDTVEHYLEKRGILGDFENTIPEA